MQENIFSTNPEVVFRIVKKKPHFAIGVRQIDFLQTNNILMTQFTKKLQNIPHNTEKRVCGVLSPRQNSINQSINQ